MLEYLEPRVTIFSNGSADIGSVVDILLSPPFHLYGPAMLSQVFAVIVVPVQPLVPPEVNMYNIQPCVHADTTGQSPITEGINGKSVHCASPPPVTSFKNLFIPWLAKVP